MAKFRADLFLLRRSADALSDFVELVSSLTDRLFTGYRGLFLKTVFGSVARSCRPEGLKTGFCAFNARYLDQSTPVGYDHSAIPVTD